MLLDSGDKAQERPSVRTNFGAALANTLQSLKKRWFEVSLSSLMFGLFAGAMWIVSRPGRPLAVMAFLFDNLPLTLGESSRRSGRYGRQHKPANRAPVPSDWGRCGRAYGT
jgi:hypothetical protein